MFRPRLIVPAAVVAFFLLPPAASAELALRRVMLSTGGVGYFEYESRLAGDAVLPLDIRRDQVDDVMKSIVVYDDRGGVGGISLPGEEPLREIFRDLPFSQDDLASPVALLNALKGVEVTAVGNREIAGRLVGVTEEVVALPNGAGTTVRHRVSLHADGGLRQFVLEETDTLRFADPHLQDQVGTALAAVARHSERDRRTLSIRTSGPADTERTVRVAYVIGAPLWKTSYRLTLAAGEPSLLQGWAVLENLSGEDWREVDLSVVSGNPVTFRQALYNAYYVDRPDVPVEVLGRVLPGIDEGTVETRQMADRATAAPAPLQAPPAPQSLQKSAPMAGAAEAAAPPPPSRPAAVSVGDGTEATTQVMFRYPQPVTLGNGSSLLLPIVSRPAPAQRVALYQPKVQPRHPLAAVRLTNDGAVGLPPGILTLYERTPEAGQVTYVGDARLGTLPVGGERLLSFAVDQKITIDRRQQTNQTTTQAKIADGLLQIGMVERSQTAYTIAGAAREARTVIVEHPRQPGWDLAEPKGDRVEVTADAYRLPVEVPAGQTVTLAVVLERPRLNEFQLPSLAIERIAFFATARDLPESIRQAMVQLGTLRAAVTQREHALEQLEKNRGEEVADQERLRENLGSVPEGSDLHRRYLAKLGEQENDLEKLKTDIAQARDALAQANTATEEFIRGLKVGGD